MSPSSTADATSSVVSEAVRSAIAGERSAMDTEKLKRVEALTRKIQDLGQRGLLRKEEFKASSPADFDRRYRRGGGQTAA